MDQRETTGQGEKNPGSVHVGFVVDKVALGYVFPPSTLVFSCKFHFTGAPLLGITTSSSQTAMRP
jgi:hypothetical protein